MPLLQTPACQPRDRTPSLPMPLRTRECGQHLDVRQIRMTGTRIRPMASVVGRARPDAMTPRATLALVAAALLVVDRRAGRARCAERRPDPGLPQAGRTGLAAAGARAAGVDERHPLADHRRVPEPGRPGNADRAPRRRQGLDCRPHRRLRRRRPSRPSRASRPSACRCRPTRRSTPTTARSGRCSVRRCPSDTELVKSQAMVDALLEYPIRSARSRFSIDPHYRLLGLKALTVLRFVDGGWRRARAGVSRRPRPRPARSALAPGGRGCSWPKASATS